MHRLFTLLCTGIQENVFPINYNGRKIVCSMILLFTSCNVFAYRTYCVLIDCTQIPCCIYLCGVLRMCWSQIREFNIDLRVPHMEVNISSFLFSQVCLAVYSNAPVVSLEWVEIEFQITKLLGPEHTRVIPCQWFFNLVLGLHIPVILKCLSIYQQGGMLECDFHQILIITIDLVANTITDHIKLLFIWQK